MLKKSVGLYVCLSRHLARPSISQQYMLYTSASFILLKSSHLEKIKGADKFSRTSAMSSEKALIRSKSYYRRSQSLNGNDDASDEDDNVMENKEKLFFSPNREHPGYKDMHLRCTLQHAFQVIEKSFNMKEENIEDFYYNGRMRVNKERIGKRHAKVKTGDVIDLIKEVTETDVAMKRVEVLHLDHKKSPQGTRQLVVRRWKHLKLKRILET